VEAARIKTGRLSAFWGAMVAAATFALGTTAQKRKKARVVRDARAGKNRNGFAGLAPARPRAPVSSRN